jgi:hypothetical protein
MAASANATPAPKRKPASRKPVAPPTPPPAAPDGPLRFSTAKPPERELLFSIDDTEYTIPVKPPAHIGIDASKMIVEGDGSTRTGMDAEEFVMREMLGEEGFAALIACEQVSLEDYKHLLTIVTDRAMGRGETDETEDEPAPNR